MSEQPPTPPPTPPPGDRPPGRIGDAPAAPPRLVLPEGEDQYVTLEADDDRSDVQYVAFQTRWLRRSVILVLFLVLAFEVGRGLFWHLKDFLFVVLLAWLLAIAMEPIVAWLSKHGMRRGLAAGLVLLGALLGFLAFVGVFGSLLATQLTSLIEELPTITTEVVDWINRTFDQNINPDEIINQLNLSSGDIQNIVTNLAGGILGVLTSAVEFLFNAFTLLVFAFYLSADGPRLRRTIGSWLPPRHQKVFTTVWEIAVAKTGGFVISRVVLAIASSFFHCLFFRALDIPFWLPLGVFAGVTSQFIPTIGTYIGVAFPALFAVFDEPWDAVWIIAFATVYQQVENYIFTPRISRVTMNVHPAIAIGSVIVGAAIFGPIGALIGIPIAAGILAVVETYGHRYQLLPELAEMERGELSKAQRKNLPQRFKVARVSLSKHHDDVDRDDTRSS